MIWVEVLDRHHNVAARHRLAHGAAIGRAYDNDVLLDDATVAPHHLRVVCDERGIWFAEDLGSVNGLHVDGQPQRGKGAARVMLAGDQVLRIGRSLLRFRGADFPVAPERAMGTPLRVGRMAIVAAITCAALLALDIWIDQTARPELSSYVTPIAGVAALVLVWVGIWSLISRSFGGHAWFERHLLAALCGVAVCVIVFRVWDLLIYALTLAPPAKATMTMGWLMLALTGFVHLRIVGPGHLRLKAAAMLLIALAAVGLQQVIQNETDRKVGSIVAVTLLPPGLRIVDGHDDNVYFARAGKIRARLDQARFEDRPEAAADDEESE